MRYFANTGGRMPRHTLDRLREIFPSAQPYLMYGLTEAFRSTYLDPSEVDRRPDSIGKAIPNAEILVVRPDGALAPARARRASSSTAARSWRSATGTTRSETARRFRPLPGPAVGLAAAGARGLVGRHRGRPTRRASSTSSAATTT